MNADFSDIGAIVAAAAAIATGAWAWWLKNRRAVADTVADEAASAAQAAVADAQRVVYQLLQDRLTALESEMRVVRGELQDERRRGRRLELHIFTLEGLMRAASLAPPVFDAAA